jgi:hypothetical protein
VKVEGRRPWDWCQPRCGRACVWPWWPRGKQRLYMSRSRRLRWLPSGCASSQTGGSQKQVAPGRASPGGRARFRCVRDGQWWPVGGRGNGSGRLMQSGRHGPLFPRPASWSVGEASHLPASISPFLKFT